MNQIGPREVTKKDCRGCVYLSETNIWEGYYKVLYWICTNPNKKQLIRIIKTVTYNSDTPDWCPLI